MASVAWEFWLATYVDATGDVALASALAAESSQAFSGTGAVALGSTLAGTADATFSGTGVVALAAALAASGTEAVAGTGAVAQSYAIAGTEDEAFIGTGDVAGGFALAAVGDGAQVQQVYGGSYGAARHPAPPVRRPTLVPIRGRAALAVRGDLDGSGAVNDDELILLLAA